MTPERKAYLAKCNAKECRLRDLIQSGKSAVKRLKGYLRTSTDYPKTIQFIVLRSLKTELSAYRHELARLKGMDRVVVIGDDEPFVNTLTGAEHWTCKCGTGIYVTDNYCSNCGKRVLWRR